MVLRQLEAKNGLGSVECGNMSANQIVELSLRQLCEKHDHSCIVDTRCSGGCINGMQEPNIASRVPGTHPKRAGLAKNIEVSIVLTPTI